MSLLHRLWVYLKCERCEKMHETDIRFRCWAIEIEDYTLGERVPDREHLNVGEIYEGDADRYCPDCFRKWALAQAVFSYESLGELIEQGRVSTKDPVSGNTLSKQDVLECGRRYIEEELIQGECIVVTMPYFTELEVSFDGELVSHELEDQLEADTWGKLLEAMCPLIERRFRNDGWTDPDRTWRDFRMHLDEDRRIIVEDEQGERVPEWKPKRLPMAQRLSPRSPGR